MHGNPISLLLRGFAVKFLGVVLARTALYSFQHLLAKPLTAQAAPAPEDFQGRWVVFLQPPLFHVALEFLTPGGGVLLDPMLPK